MKRSFLQQAAQAILSAAPTGDLSAFRILAPNQRTRLFLQKALAEAQERPMWAPRLLTIEEWAAELSGLETADSLTLLLELWQVWRDEDGHQQDFDQFYVWAEVMLADFDRIDNALLDPKYVFSLVEDWQRLTPDPSEFFSTEEEPLRQQRLDFWRKFAAQTGESHQRLQRLFRDLHRVYLEFGQRIVAQGFAYQGLVNRIAADRLGQATPEVLAALEGAERWFWVGFSNLTAAELALLRQLRQHAPVSALWDVDSYYLDDDQQAAGRWFRRQGRQEMEQFRAENPEMICERLAESPLTVEIMESSGNLTQVKLLAQELEKLSAEQLARTVVVLPDEKLLYPLLMSLPLEVKDFNVTMGSPLSVSPLRRLVELLFEVQTAREMRGDEPYWPRALVQSLLLHPYVRNPRFLSWMERDRDLLYQQVSLSQLLALEPTSIARLRPEQLFQVVEEPAKLLSWVIDCLFALSQQLESSKIEMPLVEREQLFAYYGRLIQLRNLLEQYGLVLEPRMLARVALKYLNVSQPFSGEPLADLQIMGLFETRNLDFDQVFILSMNEGVVPPAPATSSLIPEELAPNFALPTWRERQDQACYMVWRCLQRAERAVFIYSSVKEGELSGVPSRILDQFRYEWRRRNPQVRIVDRKPAPPANEHELAPPSLSSDEGFGAQAAHWLSQKAISASSLNVWMTCRLKFALQHLLGLKELPPLQAELEARHVGTLMHDVMEKLYGDLVGRTATASDFAALDARVQPLVRERLRETLGQPSPNLTGEARLIDEQLTRRIREIVRQDQRQAPFEIVGLEAELKHSFALPVGGREFLINATVAIDRVDRQQDGFILLLDYKTGRHQVKISKALRALPILDSLFDSRRFADANTLNQLNQAFFYLWLYNKLHPQETCREFVWYAFDGDEERAFRRKPLSEALPGLSIDRDFLLTYEAALNEQLSQMLASDGAFSAVEDERFCQWCDFAGLCYRDMTGE